VVDRWGIPVLRFHWQWSDYELNQVKHMQETFRALIDQMGGQVQSTMPTKEKGYGIATGGSIIHSSARCGWERPAKSALNSYCQTTR
jgi:hypothetical protein